MLTVLTVRPDEVLCLAQLLKRWPYRSAERVCFQVWDIVFSKRQDTAQSNLEIYIFNGLQRNSAGEIFLSLACDSLPSKEDFDSYCSRCGDIFFLKQEVEKIEADYPEYQLFPYTPDRETKTVCCDDNTLPLVAKVAIYALCHGLQWERTSFPHDFQIPKDRLFPWLGPIAPDVSSFGDTSKSDKDFDHTQVTRFLEAAKMLGQEDKKVLAHMVAHRFPFLTWEQLARHINCEPIPEKAKKDGTRQKQGRQLLGKA